ncbi:LANO_0B03774g1_1 [Lachancea nothofagi CBS 11611]|uniref:LANO_0B03774g1_1 n=1 Tax=Lachancea nothofagi CBS 11611 TaxID=1266666 RepID=A0A1G4IXE6_9SACH|nr:LANO_0B03774g1_1 [Lachancea nothofagi CBS 11611]
MKFAEHLRESAVPEWIDKYIDYKAGKKKLKSCRHSIDASQVLINNVSISQPTGVAVPGNKNARYLTQNAYTAAQKHFVIDFVEKWVIDQELEKCNDFYLWEVSRCGKRFAVLQEQINRYELHKEQLQHEEAGRFMSTYKSYGSVNSLDQNKSSPVIPKNTWIRHISSYLQEIELMPSLPNFVPFKRLIGKGPELKGPSAIGHGETFTPVALSGNQIRQRLSDALIEEYLLIQLIKNYREVNVTGFRKIVKKFDKTCGTSELPHFMDYAKKSFPLFQDADANAKILAHNIRDSVMLRQPAKITSSTEVSDPLLAWEQKITTWYTDVLSISSKDRKGKIARLKNISLEYSLSERKVHRFNRSILQMFVGGFCVGAALTLIGYTLYVGFTASTVSNIHTLNLPLWGGWYMVFLMCYLFLLDCFIWHKNNINYRFIMFGEMHSRHGAVLFNNDFSVTKIPLIFYFSSVLVLPMAILSALSFHSEKLTPYSIIWIVLAVILFLLPSLGKTPYVGIPYWNKLKTSVIWLIVTFIRLVFSGFFPVQFGDFFLGDIFSSLTYSMGDIALFFCVYSGTPNGLCGSSHSKSMGALTCLPNFWRFMQCIRRFSDSGDWFPHLLNGLKYILGICYYASLCAYRLSRTRERRDVFIVFAALNATITSVWDIIMDWSLLQINSRNWLLRDDLYLAGRKNWKTGVYSRRRKVIYYAAMVWDVLMRFQWVVYAVAPATMQQSAVTTFILAALEVSRRFVWVVFRVENEHVANVHLFKVSGEVSLPFPSTVSVDTDTEASISSGHYSLSDVNNPQLPSAVYRGEGPQRSKSSGLFKTFSKSIPWAHARDFQRPESCTEEDKPQDSDASESEAESAM